MATTEAHTKTTNRYINEFLDRAAAEPGKKIRVNGDNAPHGYGPPWGKKESSAGVTKSQIKQGVIPGPYEGQPGRFGAEKVPYNKSTVTLEVWQHPEWSESAEPEPSPSVELDREIIGAALQGVLALCDGALVPAVFTFAWPLSAVEELYSRVLEGEDIG